MTKKEFYLIALVALYTYLLIIFQINLTNYIAFKKNPNAKITFNLFK